MILVDSSVWIDFFNGIACPETDRLDCLLGQQLLMTGDLILAEVLPGFRRDTDFQTARDLLAILPCHDLAGEAIALQSAIGYRLLRSKGVTIRKTTGMLIGT
ncbi:MAG TPA: VapC toxin family PIN domain ribonuclease [Candidatus Competibacteraceae bacterium]|nr:VapC toxin family PIN domain ribonuclease [Candidatus Competibacteraceae bacterium]